MLTITTGELRDNYFMSGMRKLAHYNFKKPRDSYNVAKLFKSFSAALELSQKPFVDMAKRHAILDDKGEIATPPNSPDGAFKIRDEAAAGWAEALREFNAMPVELTGSRVSLVDCVAAGLNPAELSRMDALVLVLEEEKAGETEPA